MVFYLAAAVSDFYVPKEAQVGQRSGADDVLSFMRVMWL